MTDRLTPETIEGLRASNRKDVEAARLLDCAADYVERGWTQCCDAVDANGNGVPVWSKRAECWCALGAVRAANIRIGLVTLWQDALGNLHQRELTPFAASVYSRALCAALQAMVGATPQHPAMLPSAVTRWNDTEAMSGAPVARKLREGAAIIRTRIRDVQCGIAEAAS